MIVTLNYDGIYCAPTETTTTTISSNRTAVDAEVPSVAALTVDVGANKNSTPAAAAESARLLLLDQEALADLHRVDNLTRQHTGDTFYAYGKTQTLF